MPEPEPKSNVFFPRLVHLYREALTLERRLEIANLVYTEIHHDLRIYLITRVEPNSVEDVLNETLMAIFSSLDKFRENSNEQFFKWCYRIARNKACDMRRKDRLDILPMEEFSQLLDASATQEPLSPGDKLDFEHLMNLLKKSKPNCRELLLDHFYFGFNLVELGEELKLKYDAVRMRVERCLETARELMA